MNSDPDKIEGVAQLPVRQRRKTDFFCAIFMLVYVVLLAIILAVLYNGKTLAEITYPTDNSGKLCGYDYPNYPYVYYTSTTDPTKRLCVNRCPKAGQTALSCKPTATLGCRQNSNPLFQVQIYNTYLNQGRIGLICLPTDPALRQQVLNMSGVAYKYHILSVMNVIVMSLWIAAILGPLFFLLAHFFPYKVVPWTIFLGGLFSIIFGILNLVLHGGYLIVKLLLCIFFVFLGIISLRTLAVQDRRDAVIVCSRLVHAAALTHKNQDEFKQLDLSLENLKTVGKPFLLIIAYVFIYILFFGICIWEGLAVWSVGHISFIPHQLFLSVSGFASSFLFVLLLIQLVWGAFFIKQSYNFIAGSHAVYWYYSNDGEPSFLDRVKHLLLYHWGSVVGGSLIQGFFYFIDLTFDFFNSSDKPDKPVKDSFGNYIPKKYDDPIDYDRTIDRNHRHCCQDFFNLIRGEAICYVSLTNQNYCNSARHCEFLSSNSRFYDYSQTTNRMFRINFHIVPLFIILVIAVARMGPAVTPYAIMLVAILSYFMVTYFVSYHAEKTEGLLVSIYVDEALNDAELSQAPRVMEITYVQDVNYDQYNVNFCDLLFKDSTFAIS